MNNIKRGTFQNIRYIFNYIKIWDNKIIYYFIGLIIVTTVFPLVETVFPKLIIDNIFVNKGKKDLIFLLMTFFGSMISIYCIKTYLVSIYDPKSTFIRYQFLAVYYDKCMTIKYKYIEDANYMNSVEKICSVALGITTGVGGLIKKVLDLNSEVLLSVILSLILIKLNPVILLLLVLNGMVICFSYYRAKKFEYNNENLKTKLTRKVTYFYTIMNDFNYGKDIRLLDIRDLLMNKFSETANEYVHLVKKIRGKYIISRLVDSVFLLLREGLIYIFLIFKYINNEITIGSFFFYILIVALFNEQIKLIFTDVAWLKSENLVINELIDFIELERDNNKNDEKIPNSRDYEIELKNVAFKYPDTDRYILHNINLKIKAGEKLAIVGENGEGKTTIIKLICGLFEPTEGEILLNGINIQCLNKTDLYKLFSVVFQDVKLMSFTIAETIAANTKNNVNNKNLVASLQKAGIYEKVIFMNKGIDTHIDKHLETDGIQLSGGENQKLMLARALYKNAPIIILDEPTASLDPIAEFNLYNDFNDLTLNKTSIYISHRLTSTRFCDRIIYIKAGEIIEEGTHEQLISLNGKYANMYNIQSFYYND